MELFVTLPEEARDDFVEGYFAQADSVEMEKFLLRQLRNVLGTGQTEWVNSKLSQIRANAIDKRFGPYQAANAPSPNQWLAISHPFDRHLLVNAGPGAGKTRVLLDRVAYLIHKVGLKPDEIMVLAFNRAVVFEIRSRIRELFQSLGYGSYVRGLQVSTFHALAVRHVGSMDQDGEKFLELFASKLQKDKALASIVAKGCHAFAQASQSLTSDVIDDALVYRAAMPIKAGSNGAAPVESQK